MTKKDYKLIADALIAKAGRVRDADWCMLYWYTVDTLKKCPNFDSAEFDAYVDKRV